MDAVAGNDRSLQLSKVQGAAEVDLNGTVQRALSTLTRST